MLINIVDVEATCWDGAPPDGQVNEIIEIGICVLDAESGAIGPAHSLMVRPVLSEVSPFCVELTGIGAGEAASGGGFAEACARLTDEFDAANRLWLSWGDYDRKQFMRDCENKRVTYPFGPDHINGKALHARLTQPRSKQMGMARALEAYGMQLEGRHHRGGDDARNIARIVAQLLADHGPAILSERSKVAG
ncbi:3'-5' exonuclease [Bosea sp. BK604]|uniref:3'-5' exonuclease n=1 Tax=Bosea sp. BK604 TaxID=2512180 RepID=UPI00104CF9ED|nr:3'-5' exonuclease [Bosea sp. BK604]TCR60876.1 inhibitor of KinA sporulation pathway (predicted exonuclease) [Bosea sp. BK604]